MRGAWKPVLLHGGLVVAGAGLVAWRAGAFDPLAAAWAAVATALFAAALALRGLLAPQRFLRGLADEGETVAVLEDEAGWWGGRSLVAQGGLGLWRVESRNGKRVDLLVRGPLARRKARVRGGWRAAGREAARATRAGRAWPPGEIGR